VQVFWLESQRGKGFSSGLGEAARSMSSLLFTICSLYMPCALYTKTNWGVLYMLYGCTLIYICRMYMGAKRKSLWSNDDRPLVQLVSQVVGHLPKCQWDIDIERAIDCSDPIWYDPNKTKYELIRFCAGFLWGQRWQPRESRPASQTQRNSRELPVQY